MLLLLLLRLWMCFKMTADLITALEKSNLNVCWFLQVYIDGPFGAPTSQIFRAQHAVLIGTGIGVTPFASILQSIMHRYWQARNTCPKCHYMWTNDLSTSVLNLRKVPTQIRI